MAEEKDWREMLKEVKADEAKIRDLETQEFRRASSWAQRLNDVFNSKAANRLLPRLTKRSRSEFEQTAQQGFALVNEIMEKIIKKELTPSELSMIIAQARDIDPVDSTMFGMLKPVANAANTAFEMTIGAESARLTAQSNDMDAKELAVFRRYLAQQPEVIPVLAAMISPDRSIPGLEDISARAGKALSVADMNALAAQMNDIFGCRRAMPIVQCFRQPKKEFAKQESSALSDDQCNFYFSLAGRAEVRAALTDAAAAQKSPPPAPAP